MKATIDGTMSGITSDFDVTFMPEGSIPTDHDKSVFHILINDRIPRLHHDSVELLADILDMSHERYKEGFIISGIELFRNENARGDSSIDGGAYTINVEGYFENDGEYFWKVSFRGYISNSLDTGNPTLILKPYKFSREKS